MRLTPRRRWLQWAVAGAVGAALGREWRGSDGRERTFAWAADRDGGQLYALDDHLLIRRAVPLPAPVRVVALADGGAWVVSAPAGPARAHRLRRVSPIGALDGGMDLAPLLDAVSLGGGRIALVTGEPGLDAPRRVLLVDRGSAREVASPPRAMAAAFDGSRLALLGEQGAFDVLDPNQPDAALFSARPGARPGGVAADGAGGWWYVERGPGAKLLRLRRGLDVAATVELGALAPTALVADLFGGSLWLLDREQRQLRCVDRRGQVLSNHTLEPSLTPERLVPLAGGGFLAPAGGALLVFDGSARPVASQGGFAYLVDVSPVPRGA